MVSWSCTDLMTTAAAAVAIVIASVWIVCSQSNNGGTRHGWLRSRWTRSTSSIHRQLRFVGRSSCVRLQTRLEYECLVHIQSSISVLLLCPDDETGRNETTHTTNAIHPLVHFPTISSQSLAFWWRQQQQSELSLELWRKCFSHIFKVCNIRNLLIWNTCKSEM